MIDPAQKLRVKAELKFLSLVTDFKLESKLKDKYRVIFRWLKFFSIFIHLILLSSSLFITISAQTPTDGLMMSPQETCILLNYEYSGFDEYWEGSLLRKNQTIATVQRQSVMPMAAVGVFNKVNVFLGLPYVKTSSTEPNGGKFTGAQGLQDLMIGLKYEAVKITKPKSDFNALVSATFSTPIGKYLPDYMPYSLGLGAKEVACRAILQYEPNPFYIRATIGYSWRGYAEAERDYYYNNGSFYTKWMDVPNAWNLEGVMGAWLLKNIFRIQVGYQSIKSISGDDIRPYNAAQPTNKVQMDAVGALAQYFPSTGKGFGFLVYHNRVLEGLNAGKSNSSGIGLTYLFSWSKKNSESN